VITIPTVISRSEATSPKTAAGLLRRTTPSHRMLSPMEMTGSAVVMMDWTGARNLPSWKASWLRMKPAGPTTART
jgi:hypothetical protein